MGRVSSAIAAVVLLVTAFVAIPRAQVAAPRAQEATRQAAIPPELALDRPLPVDPAVRSGRLPNGIRYSFARTAGRPIASRCGWP